jgi:predicted RND superfamily exporter protein
MASPLGLYGQTENGLDTPLGILEAGVGLVSLEQQRKIEAEIARQNEAKAREALANQVGKQNAFMTLVKSRTGMIVLGIIAVVVIGALFFRRRKPAK